MGPEVELLEDHAEAGADAANLGLVGDTPVGRHAAQRDGLARDLDDAAVGYLEHVDAAQQRRFARAGRTDEGEDFAFVGRQRNAFEHLEFAETLMDVLELDDGQRMGTRRHGA